MDVPTLADAARLPTFALLVAMALAGAPAGGGASTARGQEVAGRGASRSAVPPEWTALRHQAPARNPRRFIRPRSA